MAAVDDADHVTAGDLREDSGDEALAHVVSGHEGGSAIHARLRPAGDGGEVGFVVGGLAEGAEEGGGRLDGGEALAADVADDNAESVGGGNGLVQVTADTCFRGGGQVEGFDQNGADAVRDRAEQDVLRDLGHEAHVGEGAFPAHAVGGQECSEDADHRGAQVGGHVVALPHVAHRAARAARGAGQDSFEGDREHGDAGDDSGAVGEGGDHGEGDEQEAHRPRHGRKRFEHQDARDIEDGQPAHPRRRGRHLWTLIAGRRCPATLRPWAARPPHCSLRRRASGASTDAARSEGGAAVWACMRMLFLAAPLKQPVHAGLLAHDVGKTSILLSRNTAGRPLLQPMACQNLRAGAAVPGGRPCTSGSFPSPAPLGQDHRVAAPAQTRTRTRRGCRLEAASLRPVGQGRS